MLSRNLMISGGFLTTIAAGIAFYKNNVVGDDKKVSFLQSLPVLASGIEDVPGMNEISPESRATHVKQYMKCEQMKNEALTSRKVRFMFNALAELDNVIAFPDKFVQCVHCDMQLHAFALTHDDSTSIIGVCQNHIRDQSSLTDAITHELVHVYDHVRAHLDINNCVHVACTEVRAAMLSGECTREKEVARGAISPAFSKPGHFAQCVRRRATNSTITQPLCDDPKVCQQAMDLAFDRCFNDRAPFYAIPE